MSLPEHDSSSGTGAGAGAAGPTLGTLTGALGAGAAAALGTLTGALGAGADPPALVASTTQVSFPPAAVVGIV
jgi:hypothetical protein